MWISIVISVIGAITGIAGVCQAHKANRLSKEANTTAEKANSLSEEANRLSKEANRIASSSEEDSRESNRIAKEANKTAGKALKASEDRLKYEWRIGNDENGAICVQNNSPNTALNVFVAAQSDKAAGNLCVAQQNSVAPYGYVRLEGLNEKPIVRTGRESVSGLTLRFQVRWESENRTLRNCSINHNVKLPAKLLPDTPVLPLPRNTSMDLV